MWDIRVVFLSKTEPASFSGTIMRMIDKPMNSLHEHICWEMTCVPRPPLPLCSLVVSFVDSTNCYSLTFVSRWPCAFNKTLTPSLPWRHLKTTHKSAKFEPFKPYCFLSGTGMWKGFVKAYSTESRFVTGPENTPFAGACVNHSARQWSLRQWRD